MKPGRPTPFIMPRITSVLLVSAGIVFVSSCADGRAGREAKDSIVDPAFGNAALWDDGRAEIAFYEVERSMDQHGKPNQQRFLVGTYLVKHDFDTSEMSKAVEASDGVPAFKYALFYELESGSYQYKRSYVVNAARADLRPFKQSFTSFDWCSNQYRELAFEPSGRVQWLLRSDDYGNGEGNFRYTANTFPVAEIPILVRGMDFSERQRNAFYVVTAKGKTTLATAELAGHDSLDTVGGRVSAEEIIVRYEAPIPSPIAEETGLVEHYWRTTGPDHLLLRLEEEGGSYSMQLVEYLRSSYWEEDIFQKLARVQERP